MTETVQVEPARPFCRAGGYPQQVIQVQAIPAGSTASVVRALPLKASLTTMNAGARTRSFMTLIDAGQDGHLRMFPPTPARPLVDIRVRSVEVGAGLQQCSP
jgi:hypothetical protein